MPPDASGLTPSDQEYKYETFEDLNPDLFEEIKLKVLIARGVQGTADAQVAETVSEK